MRMITAAWLALACGVPCAADESQTVFDAVYGKKYKAALSTAATTDDLQLARELAAAADSDDTSEEMSLFFHQKVAELAVKNADGHSLAIEANLAIIELSKEDRPAARERLAELLGRRLRTGTPAQRIAAGDQMVKVFTAAGDEQLAAKSYPDAIKSFRRALAAVPARSAAADTLNKRIEKAQSLERAASQIETLQERLLRDATDHAAADDLIRLFVTYRDDPAGAEKFLNRSNNPALKSNVPLAAKPIDELTEAQCMTLADWYRGMSETQDAVVKDAMVGRAARYLSRFLELHTTEDAERTKAALLLKQLGGLRPEHDPWEKVELKADAFFAQLWGGRRFAPRPIDVFRHSNTEGFFTVTQSSGKDLGKVMLKDRVFPGDFAIRVRISGSGDVGMHMVGGRLARFALVNFDQAAPVEFVITRKDGAITITRDGKRETINFGKSFDPASECVFGLHILRNRTVHIHELRILRTN